jgi:hypothetical protein
MTPQHHHVITPEFSRNDRDAGEAWTLHQHHGAECMNLKLLATAAAIATLAASAAQAQTQTSPQQPTQKMQQGGSITAPHGKTGASSGTVGSATHSTGQSSKTIKPAPGGAMPQHGSGSGSATGSGGASGGMSR